ncbi:MAG: hypothetical protein ACYDA0_11380 [Candidatus Dormibacteraceae bacterium]
MEAAKAVLASGPRKWFASLDDSGEARVGPHVAGVWLSKKVAIEVGEPAVSGDWSEVPVTWKATFIEHLFPVMVGKVELVSVDARTTRLAVRGMYDPPLGRLGKHLDDALLHRVAQATVKNVAETIGKTIDAAASAQARS